MWSEIVDWAFHWVLLWIAFELGKRWNEKEVAAAIAAITETQSYRHSMELANIPNRKVYTFTFEVGLTLGPKKFTRKPNYTFPYFRKGETTTVTACFVRVVA